MKKLFSIVSKMSATRFAGLIKSDCSKLLFGSEALVRGHRNLKLTLLHTRYANRMRVIT